VVAHSQGVQKRKVVFVLSQTNLVLFAPPFKAGATPLNSDSAQPIRVRLPGGGTATFKGREAWALRILMERGARGITVAELPAGVRWSHYIMKLRRGGVPIAMDREGHGGPFAGQHGRYRLTASLLAIDLNEQEVA
jgi:hypothetical protein